jgi:hypothetical protein
MDSPLIVLELDSKTAELLRDVLYAIGESQAAGAPMAPLNSMESEILGRVLRDIDIALGGPGRMA